MNLHHHLIDGILVDYEHGIEFIEHPKAIATQRKLMALTIYYPRGLLVAVYFTENLGKLAETKDKFLSWILGHLFPYIALTKILYIL